MTAVASNPVVNTPPSNPPQVAGQYPANGTQVSAPSGAPAVAGLIWRSYQVKSAGDGDKQKVVGVVVTPEFDEKNPDAGIQQILAYPWGDEELNGGVTYASAKEAIVKLVNTQLTTNIRNRKRQESSGRVSAQQIQIAALERIPPEEMQAAMRQGGLAMVQLQEKYIKLVKAEIEAKKKAEGNDVDTSAVVNQ